MFDYSKLAIRQGTHTSACDVTVSPPSTEATTTSVRSNCDSCTWASCIGTTFVYRTFYREICGSHSSVTRRPAFWHPYKSFWSPRHDRSPCLPREGNWQDRKRILAFMYITHVTCLWRLAVIKAVGAAHVLSQRACSCSFAGICFCDWIIVVVCPDVKMLWQVCSFFPTPPSTLQQKHDSTLALNSSPRECAVVTEISTPSNMAKPYMISMLSGAI